MNIRLFHRRTQFSIDSLSSSSENVPTVSQLLQCGDPFGDILKELHSNEHHNTAHKLEVQKRDNLNVCYSTVASDNLHVYSVDDSPTSS